MILFLTLENTFLRCSPKEDRCKCIHDPRVKGETEWWLQQKHILPNKTKGEKDKKPLRLWETKGFHLDFFQFDSFATTHYPLGLKELAEGFENPFYDTTQISSLWQKFCSTVCNVEEDSLVSRHTNATALSECQKLSMVLQVLSHKWSDGSHYLYHPTHVIYNQDCMLVSTHVFDVSHSGNPRKIDEDSYDSNNKHHYKVRHIVFTPRSSEGKRQASIWFDIPDEEIRSERGTCMIAAELKASSPTTVIDARILNNTRKSFTDASSLLEKPFYLNLLAHDKEYFQLVINVLKWRLTSLTSDDPFKELKIIREEQSLKKVFEALLRHWFIMNSWPVNLGRSIVTPETPVPRPDSEYRIPEPTHPQDFYSNVWGTFVTQVSQDL